jgi:hypothetical protein
MKKAVLSCDLSQNYLAKFSFHHGEVQKDHLVILVHKKDEAEKNPLISDNLKNPELA